MRPSQRDSRNWSEERDIVFEAIEIVEESERNQFVRDRCGENSELAHRVFTLLASVMSELTPPSIIDSIAIHQGTLQPGIHAESLPLNTDIVEREVGPYRIVRKLGEGGIAVVFLAEQNTPIHRKVAIKLVKPGMESMAILSRFKQEQQALESLSHNGIAKLLDAGVSPFGRPYLVLEYIDGTSITEYCNASQLSIDQRLELFLKACEAVHHAHQRGIIHRDLKPSNILISVNDQEAVATVIDFGIAKLLDARDPSVTAKTQIGQLIGTLEYMSPEQAQLGKTMVDIRSDVYALACVLYELLIGHAPLAKELSACASLEVALTLIREQTPVRPLLSQRSITTKHSKSQNFGEDLECILMKGLDKCLSQRYSTVQSMIDDIRRYLNHETVLARKPTLGYVLTRFANRHRVAIATFGIIACSLILALGASILGWIETSNSFHQVQLANERIQEAHLQVIDVNKNWR
ncbi:MAG: serine/threonine-protein kinase [Pirellulales bacterium]